MNLSQLEVVLQDATSPFLPVLTRLWLVGAGDLCSACPMRPECPDQRTCLHLTMSLGATTRVDGPYRRFPIGARQVGRVALERVPLVAGENLAELDLAEPAWLATHQVMSFVALPLADADRLVGVLALFSRRFLDETDVRSLAALARLLTSAMASADRPTTTLAGVRAIPAAAPQKSLGTLAEVQREAIERTLEQTGGRVSGPRGAAAILGLKPTTLHSRMRKLGVRRRARPAR